MLRERKRADDQIAAAAKLDSVVGDIETYINLAQEETNAQQREELVKDLEQGTRLPRKRLFPNWKPVPCFPARTIISTPS